MSCHVSWGTLSDVWVVFPVQSFCLVAALCMLCHVSWGALSDVWVVFPVQSFCLVAALCMLCHVSWGALCYGWEGEKPVVAFWRVVFTGISSGQFWTAGSKWSLHHSDWPKEGHHTSSHCSGTAIFALISGYSLCGNLPSLQEHRMGQGRLVCKPVLFAVWHMVFTASLVSQPQETLRQFDRTESGGWGGGWGVASSYCCMAHCIYLLHLWSQPLENIHHFARAEVGGGGGYRPVVVAWHMVFTTSLVTALGKPPSLW